VFDHPVYRPLPNAQKSATVTSKLPEALGQTVAKKMRAAYHMDGSPPPRPNWKAELARPKLSKVPPWSRAGSLREGLAETLTVNRLGVPPTLARTLRTTIPSSP